MIWWQSNLWFNLGGRVAKSGYSTGFSGGGKLAIIILQWKLIKTLLKQRQRFNYLNRFSIIA